MAALVAASEVDCSKVHLQTESLSECEAILQAWDALDAANQQRILSVIGQSDAGLCEDEFRILLARSDRSCAG
ncbi:hypothetical protein AOZ07_01360 [Glutamicibacter halophytocola]|nr:hypothetical protein AOZ07_01360 [Glutamicibacter halophytocola]